MCEGGTNKPVHFTYKAQPDQTVLCQGDVLEITSKLHQLFREVHPYFAGSQYKYFMVLTQSCDLVRRDGQSCKSPYITLAAVRSFNDFFNRIMVAGNYAECVNGFLLVDSMQKYRVYQLIERVYNNTEPEYFFLFKDEFLKFPESMVAYLKVTIAVKSEMHYQDCLDAKKLELEDEFKAKLGWLVGNIYSRIGTIDWDNKLTNKEKERMISNEIEARCIVGRKEHLEKLKPMLADKKISDSKTAQAFLSDNPIETNYEKAMSIIQKILDERGEKLPDTEKQIIMSSIRSRKVLKRLFSE